MNRDEQLKWAVGLALATVIFVIQFGYFANPRGGSWPENSVEDPEWEAVRIRAELPSADFVYVLSTCPSCRPANDNVELLQKSNPQSKFLWIHPSMVDMPALMEVLGKSYGIDDPTLRGVTPVLYGPARAWVGVPDVMSATLEGTMDGLRPFERMGASWDWLRHGQSEVVRRFQQYKWYMIAIVDVNLPDCNGLQLAGTIRETDVTGQIKLLYITGDSAMAQELGSNECAIEGYIIKPFGVEELIEKLSVLCRKSRLPL
jgi:CheY-like chemotaxis protein